MEKEELVKLENVTKIYDNYTIALKNINLSVRRRQFISIMGPSGSGKTTLLNLMGCLDKPTYGKVFIENVEVSRLNDKELTKFRRDKIGFIFQQYNLVQTLTVLENVELPMVFKGIDRKKREKRSKYLLKLVGLENKSNRKPNELSGGEQQRVAIARALANNPKLLLCDEPTGNLDINTGKKIMNLIKNLNKMEKITVILVTHNPIMAKYADKIIYMVDGKLYSSFYDSHKFSYNFSI